MENNRTYYHLILDRSGSMVSCLEQTVAGVNEQIMRIREIASRYPGQKMLTSLTLFNHTITNTWKRINPEELRELSFFDYRPDGNTALYDAVGITLTEIQKEVGSEIEKGEASVVVVIVTDGYENASRSFNHDRVASMIGELEKSGRWTFSYLGATLDAVDIAVSLNIKVNNAMYFDVKDSNTMWNKLNMSLYNYVNEKSMGKVKGDFLEGEEEKKRGE